MKLGIYSRDPDLLGIGKSPCANGGVAAGRGRQLFALLVMLSRVAWQPVAPVSSEAMRSKTHGLPLCKIRVLQDSSLVRSVLADWLWCCAGKVRQD